ncbi:MAG: hypothetical protein ACFCBW_09945 [Candidatus Competibacterales bacterium]
MFCDHRQDDYDAFPSPPRRRAVWIYHPRQGIGCGAESAVVSYPQEIALTSLSPDVQVVLLVGVANTWLEAEELDGADGACGFFALHGKAPRAKIRLEGDIPSAVRAVAWL